VTKSLVQLNFVKQETKMRGIVMSLLDNPIQQMREQERQIKTIRVANENNTRRLHEAEFII
jgi:hypothetical protein